ncbi:MAG: 30S ribosomal protein S20 [Fidelibacterota bacterium]
MAGKTRSVRKRLRQQRKRYQRNRSYTSQMKTLVKKVVSSSDKKQAEPMYREAVSLLDRLAAKGIIHRNLAARKKSTLSRHLNSLS